MVLVALAPNLDENGGRQNIFFFFSWIDFANCNRQFSADITTVIVLVKMDRELSYIFFVLKIFSAPKTLIK
jgi:hypothetical protein